MIIMTDYYDHISVQSLTFIRKDIDSFIEEVYHPLER